MGEMKMLWNPFIILNNNVMTSYNSLTWFQLRLLYESSPMSYIVEQAGGLATTGTQRILDIQPVKIHERCPVYMGSKDDVQDVIDTYKKHGK